MLKKGFHCICLSLLLIDSVFKIGKSDYLKVFSKECEYIVKGKRKANTLLMTKRFLLLILPERSPLF